MATLTEKQALKKVKKMFIDENGKRAYKSRYMVATKYSGSESHTILILSNGLSSELHFNLKK